MSDVSDREIFREIRILRIASILVYRVVLPLTNGLPILLFLYRYSRENQSKSEEAQRQRRKAAGEPECTPPPKPPAFAPQFLPLVMFCFHEFF